MSPRFLIPVVVPFVAFAAPAPDAAVPATLPRTGLGHTISDREFWNTLAKTKEGRDILGRAGKALKTPMPGTSDELFLEYSKTGDRDRWQKVNGERRERLVVFALAEAMENKGRYLKAYVDTANALLTEKLWVMPAHDAALKYFRDGEIHIDLGSSVVGWNLAETVRILEPKLDAALRDAVTAKVRERLITPYLAMVSGKRKADWWIDGTNNWNSVCHAGVVGAALALPIDGAERAAVVKAALIHVRHYIDSFPADGVSDEGIGYWGYGFGRYAALAEMVRLATDGKVDPAAEPVFRTVATTPARMEIDGGVWPAFGDCSVTARPDPALSAWLATRLGAPKPAVEWNLPRDAQGFLYAPLLEDKRPAGAGSALALRDWFADSGILIARQPANADVPRLAVAIKGGDNAESHNHNDNGNFMVVLDGKRIVADPGNEVYTKRTFSAHRYDSKVLSGFGHSVPVVEGVLQSPGKAAKAVVLDRSSSDDVEMLRYDLISGYPVKGLTTLTREFVYRRGAKPVLTVTDVFKAGRPMLFGGALITFGSVDRIGEGRYRITEEGKRAIATFTTKAGASLKFEIEEIVENLPYPRNPNRLGYELASPSAADEIIIRIAPEY